MSTSEKILSEFLTKQELATELGREMRTLDRWDALGIGPPRTHVGRKVLYRRATVQNWLLAQECQKRSDTRTERLRTHGPRGAL